MDPKETVTLEEVVMSSMYEMEALIDFLVEKRIITHEKLLDRVRQMRTNKADV